MCARKFIGKAMSFQAQKARQKPRKDCGICGTLPASRHSGFDIHHSSFDISPMLDLATATRDLFAPCVGQAFALSATTGAIPLTLAEARALGAGRPGATRAPFSLTFHGAPSLRLPQGIYRLENTTLGTVEIFLVQVAADAAASHFEAIFN